MKVGIILGTRAELIKCAPIILELDKKKIEYKLIHSGQHELGEFPKIFGIRQPDITLTKPPKKHKTKFYTKARLIKDIIKASAWNLLLIPRIWNTARKEKFDYIMYHGDTMTTMTAAIATSKILNPLKKHKNIHLEGGLRSGSLKEPFPEEISRKFCDLFSDIIFTVSKQSHENIKKEITIGKPVLVGNTVVDATLLSVKLAKQKKIKTPKPGYVLVYIHRLENIGSKKRLQKIIQILNTYNHPTVLLLHDATKKKLDKFDLLKELKKIKHVKIIKQLDYLEFIAYFENAKILITDGGGVQEETLTLKKPCVILRKKTERIEGLDTNINFLTGLDVKKTKKILRKLLHETYQIPKYKNPYGNGNSSKKIINYLLKNHQTRLDSLKE